MASQLTFEERQGLYRLNKAKTPKARIAEILERDRSTIYRELKRNTGGCGYRAKQAQCLTDERRLACRGEPKMSDPELKKDVKRLLKQKWSPDQITGWLRKHFPRQGNRRVSHQTIYNWLESEAPDLRVHLRRGHRRQDPETRGKLKDCVGIEGRPQAVDSKRRYGDWEGDTVVSPGRRSGIVTLRAACRGLKDLPEKLRRTMTLDNGKEFTEYQRLTDRLGMEVYFARPYASWQRGLNENTNGLLRQFFPKGTDFARFSRRQVARVESLLNERPRKRLGYQTPNQVFAKQGDAIGV